MDWRNGSLFKWSWSCDEDDAMPYGKNPLKILSESSRPITFTLRIQHQGLGPYKVCLNDDPGLTLTCFTARATLHL